MMHKGSSSSNRPGKSKTTYTPFKAPDTTRPAIATKQTPETQSTLGAFLDTPRAIPFVTICILLLSYQLTSLFLTMPAQYTWFAFHAQPQNLSGFLSASIFTSAFTHISWGHFTNNLIGWALVGWAVESVLGIRPFLLLAIVSHAGCLALHTLININVNTYLVGSSGALFGVMAFYVIYSFRIGFSHVFVNRTNYFVFIAMFQQFIMMGVNAFSDIALPISTSGHFGGIMGSLLFFKFYYLKYNREAMTTDEALAKAFTSSYFDQSKK